MADDTIETLEDWNTRLSYCGCCWMPGANSPLAEHQSFTLLFKPQNFWDGSDYRLTRVRKYSYRKPIPSEEFPDAMSEVLEIYDTKTYRGWTTYDEACDALTDPDPANLETHPGLPPGSEITAFEETSYSGEATAAKFVTAVQAKLETLNLPLPDDCGTGSSTISYAEIPESLDETGPSGFAFTKGRYRWRVPSDHTGSWFKITWDVAFFPKGWDDTIEGPDGDQIPKPDRPKVTLERDFTVEWSGPGEGEQDNESWIAGDWYALDPPTSWGEKRIVNTRYESCRNPYGRKPQITGDAYEPDSDS
jgi:hypothetical protein